MSGATAGQIGTGAPTGVPRAEVVDLHTRRHRGRSGKRSTQSETGPAVETMEESTAQRFAINVESLFLRRDMSLTDPQTAIALEATLDAVQLLLDGARAIGQLHDSPWRLLTDQLSHLRLVPDSL